MYTCTRTHKTRDSFCGSTDSRTLCYWLVSLLKIPTASTPAYCKSMCDSIGWFHKSTSQQHQSPDTVRQYWMVSLVNIPTASILVHFARPLDGFIGQYPRSINPRILCNSMGWFHWSVTFQRLLQRRFMTSIKSCFRVSRIFLFAAAVSLDFGCVHIASTLHALLKGAHVDKNYSFHHKKTSKSLITNQ